MDAFRGEALAGAGRVAVEVAHDFNNVLLAIQALATMLEGRLPEGTVEHEDAVEILRATERGAAIVRQLVTLAGGGRRPEGRTDPNGSSAALPILTTMKFVQPLDVDAALADMRRLLGRLAGPDVDLVIESEPGLPPVHFNASVLRHIVIDVVRAAAEAMPEGGRIAVRASTHGGSVELTVADTGPGASAIGLPGPYDPFYVTDGAASPGFASVHELAVSNGADVRVASTPGGGMKLSLYLPVWA